MNMTHACTVPLGAACTLPDVHAPRRTGRTAGLPGRLARFLATLVIPAFLPGLGPAPGLSASPAAPRVKGFRSARFGMNAVQVRWAIANDFPGFHEPLEARQTADDLLVLELPLPALDPVPGAAQVRYLFDASSAALVRVEIRWSTPARPTDAERTAVAAAGLQLAAQFSGRRWGPGGTVAHRAEGRNAVLLFAGWDAGNAAVELRLAGVQLAVAGGRGPQPEGASELLLCYRQSPRGQGRRAG